MRSRRGYLLLEAVGALLLVAALAGLLAMAVGRHNRAQTKLSDSRAAARMAELVLSTMQNGGTAPAGDAETRIAIKPAEGGAKLDGHAWVEVDVRVRGQAAGLIGLVPASAVPKGEKP